MQGRFFSRDISTDSGGIILNETAVKVMGMADPIGKKGPFNAPILGVMKDFNFHPLNLKIEPFCLMMLSDWDEYIALRIQSKNISATLAHIKDVYDGFVSDFPFEYSFLDNEFESLYKSEERLGLIFSYFAGLAIIISCMGLFGLATYSAEQRTKEIGIRKVLGATIPGIIGLLSKEFLILVSIANIIAWPVAYYAINLWLQNFAYKVDISLTIFLVAGFGTLVIALLTILFKAVTAARANPVKALRYE